jgi:signal transduction histidine kinase
MTFEKPTLIVCIGDNGVGFNPDANGPLAGNGLNNIKRRLANIGGSCVIESQPDRGTTVQMRLTL